MTAYPMTRPELVWGYYSQSSRGGEQEKRIVKTENYQSCAGIGKGEVRDVQAKICKTLIIKMKKHKDKEKNKET